jgi:AraC family transcriptional activator of pobA
LYGAENVAEYADKVVHIDKNALLFATPKIPYNVGFRRMTDQSGYFCIFTSDFL